MSTSPQTDSAGLFYEQLRLVLNNYHDPQWLGEHSPLAAPYFLGASLSEVAEAGAPAAGAPAAGTAVGRGRILQQVIQTAANSLWDGPLPKTREALETAVQAARQEQGNKGNQYHFFLLELRYLRRFFRSRAYPSADSEQAIRDYLGVGRGPYFNHLKAAREALGEALIQQLQPTLRLEQPPKQAALIGRDDLITDCLAQLQANQTIAITGMGGVGKTALATAIASRWPVTNRWASPPVFWFTLRPTLNDQLSSLLFSLGYFLHQRGASGLWLQLVADGGKPGSLHLALEQVRGDLHALQQKPLLCLDECDHLSNEPERMTAAQQQFLSFLDGLRGLAPLLLIGQRVPVLADEHLTLTGLSLGQTQTVLAQSGTPYSEAEAARLHSYTSGNARMVWLCAALCQEGQTLTAVLESLPKTAVFQTLFARLWQVTLPDERRLLQRLAVFRSPAPEDAFSEATAVLNNLVARHLLQRDGRGALLLLPIIHDLIYEDRHRLPAAERERAHLAAAAIRAERGEYTAAAYHFVQAGEGGTAVQLWYPSRQQEIKRGQAGAALAIFEQLSPRRLPEAEAQALALLRAELHQLAGDSEQGLATLDSVAWPGDGETAVQAQLLRGNFLNALGQPHAALEKLEDGLAALSRLMEQMVRFRQQRALIHIQQWQMQDAIQEARQAQFTAEHLQGLIQEQQGNFDEAYLAYHKALALARSVGYEAGMANTNRSLANVLMRQSKLAEARLHLQAALDYYERIGDQLSWEKSRSTLAGIHFQAGEYEQMIAIGEASLPFFERAKIPYFASVTTANLAESYFAIGNLDKAELYAHKTLSSEEPNSFPYALYTLGLVRRTQQRLTEAEAHCRQAQEVAASNADVFMEAFALRLLGEVLADQSRADKSRREEANSSLNQSLRLFERLNIPSEIETTRNLLAE
jgi:tetratricopeptide (TPR) repeat protein